MGGPHLAQGFPAYFKLRQKGQSPYLVQGFQM